MIDIKDVLGEVFVGLQKVEQTGYYFTIYFTQAKFRDKAYYRLMGKFGSTVVDKSTSRTKLLVKIHKEALRLLLGDILLGDFNESD